MTRYTTTSSRPHESVLPRARSGYTREHTHGRLVSLDEGEATTKEIFRLIGRPWLWIVAPAVTLALAYAVDAGCTIINVGAGM